MTGEGSIGYSVCITEQGKGYGTEILRQGLIIARDHHLEKEKPCSFQDDFDELGSLLEAADVIVISTPIYWFSFPGYIKVAIDKMNAYLKENCRHHLKIKESILLVCGADEGMEIFNGIIVTYRQIANYMKWEDKGILAVPNVKEKGDIENTDALKKAEELGKSL